jgi:hypothetical protein
MGFLRRLFGAPGPSPDDDARSAAPDDAGLAADEQARDRELRREDARRLDDELLQRQLRYADRSWTPPAQGGTRRADDDEDGGSPPD